MSAGGRPEPILLSYGFRPFFLLAAAWSAGAIGVWLWLLHTGAVLPSRFDDLTWHVHEMLFGFVMAAVAGFLLTAVANWTGRPPVRGISLGVLIAAWIAGRLVCWFSAKLPAALVVAADLTLPVLLVALVLREVIAARNWRNLPMVVPVVVLGTANLLMHLETLGVALPPGLGWRLAVAAMITLVSAVAGRIVPAFTQNWLKKGGRGDLPPHGVLDRVSLAFLHVGLLTWAFFPANRIVGILLILAAGLNLWRLLRWRGFATREEFLLLILHIGYCWMVVGVALLGLATLPSGVPLTAAIHALTVGTVGTMILAVMTRATRGHTGRPLSADPATAGIYVLVLAAACARVAAGFGIWYPMLLDISAVLWIAAYTLFAIAYGPILIRPKAVQA
jgi:uncharacterized protein involved in response to NO